MRPTLVQIVPISAAVVLVFSCSTDPTVPRQQPACCLADPVPHEVTLLDCTDDADCALGTACLDAQDLPDDYPRANDPYPTLRECRGPAQKGNKVCGIPSTRSGSRQALTGGFK